MTNDLFVLSDRGGALTTIGSLTGLAPGERLYASRFFGDRAYLVTYHQIDPLIAVDLTDPTNPKLGGMLEIPGFSRYLQPIDATHLIAVGQGVQAGANEPSDVVISLFDVSDLANPRRVDFATISTNGWFWLATSQSYDHHQVSYFPETQTLAIPVNGYALPSDTPGDWGPSSHDALFVFKVDPASGLTPLGKVEADANVLRSTRIGDTMFTVSRDVLTATPLTDPSIILGQVQYQDPKNFIDPSWFGRTPPIFVPPQTNPMPDPVPPVPVPPPFLPPAPPPIETPANPAPPVAPPSAARGPYAPARLGPDRAGRPLPAGHVEGPRRLAPARAARP